MDPFRLTEDAILDIDAIRLYLLERDGVETADRIVTELFKRFYKLADIPKQWTPPRRSHEPAGSFLKDFLLPGHL